MSPGIIEGEVNTARKRRSSEGESRRTSRAGVASLTSARCHLVSDSSVDPLSQRPMKLSKKAEKRLEVEARKRARLEAQEAKKKKKKSMLSTRKKGPANVDTQCGVINDKGLPCSRSLTCKSHSMGAKRAVPGRSRPYDELLLEWQRIHNPALVAKLEERERAVAASKAAAAERKNRKALEKRKKIRSRDASAATAEGGMAVSRAKEGGGPSATNGTALKIQEDPQSDMFSLGFSEEDVDVEIKELIMAIRSASNNERTKILPLAQHSFAGLYTRKLHTLRSCRELLREGLRNSARTGPSNAFSVPFDASNAPSLVAAQAVSNS